MWQILLDALLVCTLIVGSAVGALGLLLSYLFAKGRKGRWVSWLTWLTLASWTLLIAFCCLIIFSFANVISPLISSFFTVMSPRVLTRNDLIGVWVPTESSLKQMSEAGYKFSTHTLEFSRDGTIVMTNMPAAWFNGTSEPKGAYYTTRGTWEIVRLEGGWKVNVQYESVAPRALKGATQFEWIGTADHLYISQYNGELASFEKCGKPHIRISNEVLKPLVTAIGNVDRQSLGFTPIESDARVEIAGEIGNTRVSLNIDGDTSRRITFKREGDSYRWIGEQEIHEGPERWMDHDAAVWQEEITVNYQTEPINGIPLNTVYISYDGHDPRLLRRPFELTLADIQPILSEWKQWRQQRIPLPVSFCP